MSSSVQLHARITSQCEDYTASTMKLLHQLLWALLSVSVDAGFEAQIYLPEADRVARPQPPTLSPSSARLLIAQRLGLAEYHEIGDTNDQDFEIIGLYGGTQKPLFSSRESGDGELLVLEGILHPSGGYLKSAIASALTRCLDIVGDRSPDVLVASPPLEAATSKLAADLSGQRKHQRGTQQESVQTIRYVADLKVRLYCG